MNIRGAKHERTSKNIESVQWEVWKSKYRWKKIGIGYGNVMDELRNGWTYFEYFELFEYFIRQHAESTISN